MKIKLDFVSNSSSTSFIYISKQNFNAEVFYEAIGVGKSSPMFDFFQNMYSVLNYAIQRGEEISDANQITITGDCPDFTPEVAQRVSGALKDGARVILGELSSDDELAASILCMEMFEIESDSFYINAYNNYW